MMHIGVGIGDTFTDCVRSPSGSLRRSPPTTTKDALIGIPSYSAGPQPGRHTPPCRPRKVPQEP